MATNKKTLKPVVAAVSMAFVAGMAAVPVVQATENPFTAQTLSAGYAQTQLAEGKSSEGKCGEAKCGADKAEKKVPAEGSCGEGKKAGTEATCGADAEKRKTSPEGKCGEAKCGSNQG